MKADRLENLEPKEQHSSKFLRFSFCLKYARTEEADNLETPTEANKKKSPP